MIEAAMYVALGFLSAGLFCLAIIPAIYRRAVRLTKQAVEAVNPSTYREVTAVHSQERARHAMELRKTERALENQKQDVLSLRLECNRQQALIKRLRAERDAGGALLVAPGTDGKEETVPPHVEISRLQSELDKARSTLSDTEKSLATANADLELLRAEKSETRSWLPTDDAMALATITGLESQIATLKRKVSETEDGTSSEQAIGGNDVPAANLQPVIADLEKQLVDMETNFVTAQAEVTRLSLQMDLASAPQSETTERLDRELKLVGAEKARLTALARDRERALLRARAEVDRLRQDLRAAPGLEGLRGELKELVSTVKETAKPKTRRKTTAKAKPAGGTADKKPATTRARKAATSRTRKTPAPGSSETKVAAPSAADLASKIVKASRANADKTGPKAADPVGENEADKTAKKDVA